MDTIGLDFGSCNLKTNTGIIVPSKITSDTNNLFEAEYVVEYEGKNYIIGEGDYDTTLDKTKKENIIPMLCLMLGLSTKDDVVRIVAGLPINQYKSKEKDNFQAILHDNRMLNFKLNGVNRQIIIENNSIAPEGIASYYSMDYKKRLLLKDKDIILLDIGGRTTDIALIKAGSKRRISKSTSLELGMINIYNDLINEINTRYTLGLEIEDAEKIIKNGLEVDGEKKDTEFMKDIIKSNMDKVFKELNINYPIRTSPLLVTGGGGEAFFKSIKRRYLTADLIDNYMFSNAIGYKKIGDKLWKD
ncbi:ParM/StbA family protein [Clostridium botulinum]|uniref:ParM/StbA family protein n=1 Tax=Clostridium botulinum TaxID=1491 RepID=UPI001968970A|nr:ParM/StbA family protein [Clostridium botulinum]MBN1058598.1 hypothetical protein [Clostridium botulinum]